MLVSEYFELDDELDKMGVFGCILDNDSSFFLILCVQKQKRKLMFECVVGEETKPISGWELTLKCRFYGGKLINSGLNQVFYRTSILK